jgi:hypothetical protein
MRGLIDASSSPTGRWQAALTATLHVDTIGIPVPSFLPVSPRSVKKRADPSKKASKIARELVPHAYFIRDGSSWPLMS